LPAVEMWPTCTAPGSSSAYGPYAYVSLLGGVGVGNGYRGMLLSIAITARRLKALGSTADVVAIVVMHPETVERRLSMLDTAVLERHGVRLHYVDVKTLPWPSTLVTFAKALAWNFTCYRAIQYLDADVMPMRNMDGFFALNSAFTACAGSTEPLHAGWFLLRPDSGVSRELLRRIAQRPDPFSFEEGWGAPSPQNIDWTNMRGGHRSGWRFNGADGDQGLWYYHMRYFSTAGHLIVHDRIISFRSGQNTSHVIGQQQVVTEPFQLNVSSPTGSPCLYKSRSSTPSFAHFTGKSKPWMHERRTDSNVGGTLQLWWAEFDNLHSEMPRLLTADMLRDFAAIYKFSAIAVRPPLGFMFSLHVEHNKELKRTRSEKARAQRNTNSDHKKAALAGASHIRSRKLFSLSRPTGNDADHLDEAVAWNQRPSTLTKPTSKAPVRECMHAFFDLGTNVGDALKSLVRLASQPGEAPKTGLERNIRARWSEWGIDPLRVCYVGVEGNPRFTNELEQLGRVAATRLQSAFLHTQTVVSNQVGETTLHLDTISAQKNYWGSSLAPNHDAVRCGNNAPSKAARAKYAAGVASRLSPQAITEAMQAARQDSSCEGKRVQVKSVTLTSLMHQHLTAPSSGTPSDGAGRAGTIMVKMDVEGAEYMVLDELASSGTACEYTRLGYAFFMIMETHSRRV